MSRLLIRASAGSGKTFRLSGHFLRQLYEGSPPESILATTFTRKAAGEILGRVLTRLSDAAEDPAASAKLAEFLETSLVTQESSQALLAEVTHNLHRMRVCTLDSFFQLLARSLTLELGLPPGWSIIDEHVDQDLKQQAIDSVLAQHVSKDAQQLMQMLAKGRSKRSVRDLIDDAVSKFYELYQLTDREAWLRFPKPQRQRDDLLRDHVILIRSMLPDLDKRVQTSVTGDLDRFQNRQWDSFITSGVATKIVAGHPVFYSKPLPDGLVEAYEPLIKEAKAHLTEQLARQTYATWELISRFDREYSRLRAEHGGMRFSDVTRILARSSSAADGTRLQFRLDSTIRHLLLDEFQDTSPDQWHILKDLALSIAGKSRSRTRSDKEDRGKDSTTFFCVGDGKQAIYGWRGGEAEILNAVEKSIPEIKTGSLNTSQRSSLPVIETVNQLFQHISQHKDLGDYEEACHAWQKLFPTHSTAKTTLPGYAELRTGPFLDTKGVEDKKGPWYRWVASQIRDLYEQAPGHEIGVLTRRNATVARLVHELTLLGVPASEEGGTAPLDSPAVLAIMSLLHLCSHPGCQISRFHVSGSPLGQIVGLTAWDDDKMALEVAQALRNQLIDDGYGRTLQNLLDHIRPHCNARDLLRMRQVIAAGWQFDESPSLNAADFVRLLETSRFSRSEPAPVRVMTVHQSKGLEFDIVVLPELDARLFLAPAAAAGGNEAGEAPEYVSIWRNKSMRDLLPEPIQKAFEQTTASHLSETLCLLYVAMTRAVHALHMLIEPFSKKLPKTYAGVLFAGLTDAASADGNAVLYSTGNPDWMSLLPTKSLRKVHQIKPAFPSRTIELAPMSGGRRRGLARQTPSRHDETRLFLPAAEIETSQELPQHTTISHAGAVDPRTRGTVIHAWFECIEWLPDGTMPDEQLLRKRAAELSIPEPAVESLLVEFRSMLNRPVTRGVMSRQAVVPENRAQKAVPFGGGVTSRAFARWADEIRSGQIRIHVLPERSFVLPKNGTIIQGTMDRLVLARKNQKNVAADIVDFKTDRVVGPVREWISARTEHYAPQLDIYIHAVEHCFRVPREHITARLLLLEADAVADVTV